MALAHLTVLVHAGFVAFVLLGGGLVARWPRVAWVHVPAVAWAVGIEWAGGVCPLTPLEQELRARGGLTGYEGDFVGRYLIPVLYPAGLTRPLQVAAGAFALLINIVAYGVLWRRAGRRRDP